MAEFRSAVIPRKMLGGKNKLLQRTPLSWCLLSVKGVDRHRTVGGDRRTTFFVIEIDASSKTANAWLVRLIQHRVAPNRHDLGNLRPLVVRPGPRGSCHPGRSAAARTKQCRRHHGADDHTGKAYRRTACRASCGPHGQRSARTTKSKSLREFAQHADHSRSGRSENREADRGKRLGSGSNAGDLPPTAVIGRTPWALGTAAPRWGTDCTKLLAGCCKVSCLAGTVAESTGSRTAARNGDADEGRFAAAESTCGTGVCGSRSDGPAADDGDSLLPSSGAGSIDGAGSDEESSAGSAGC